MTTKKPKKSRRQEQQPKQQQAALPQVLPRVLPKAPSAGQVLSSTVHIPVVEWKEMLEKAIFCKEQFYMIVMDGCGQCKMMLIKSYNMHRPKDLTNFRAADRTATFDPKDEFELYHEVLEVVLSEYHSVGGKFSDQYAAILECRGGTEKLLPPPMPKGPIAVIQDAFLTLKAALPIEESEDREEKEEEEQEPLVEGYRDSPEVEMLLCRGLRPEETTKEISVMGRRASEEEVQPYMVELHYSQKQWHERMKDWMQDTFNKKSEMVADARDGCAALERPAPMACGPPGHLMTSFSDGSMLSGSERIPREIEVATDDSSNDGSKSTQHLLPRDNIWIPEYDVVFGVSRESNASTKATEIFKRRVLTFFVTKTNIRESQVQVMKLMLKEEIEDEETFDSKTTPDATFWMKLADCTDDEAKKDRSTEAKWLKKEDGDFLGPFVRAPETFIYKAVVEWIKAYDGSESGSRDPEPCMTKSFATAAQGDDNTVEEVPHVSAIEAKVPHAAPQTQQKGPNLFQLTGPIETLDQKAKETCQDWVNDSETLLIKAAKKTLIDSFQQDFHSFLFLFQLQLKRIKGGYTAGGSHSVASGSPQGAGGDDCSWVSAEPSVQEADTRIADIEKACIDFMNRMGNNMVKRYQELSGEDDAAAAAAAAAVAAADEARDDDGTLEDDDDPSVGSEGRERGSNPPTPTRKHALKAAKAAKDRTTRHEDDDDPALLSKDDTTCGKTDDQSFDYSEASTPERFLRQLDERKGRPSRYRQPLRKSRTRSPPPRRGRSPRRHRDDSYSEEDRSVRSYRSRSYGRSFDDRTERTWRSRSLSYERSPSPEPSYVGGRTRNRRGYDYDSPQPTNSFTDDDDTYPTRETGPLDSVSLANSDLSLAQLTFDKPKAEAGWFGMGW
ncbi:expressed unknown protein [Seminavis robusta]|uniref:Uncharacterized protein n=1 Tax=Seminavis robusta TaxID=568900 RepID=A0A9N8DSR1_9STRA|nr:expressed unknown protein [Seminavis robusta]|eukprot:Sro326_g118000.1 n/a (896) ;mRNA; f:13404-16091